MTTHLFSTTHISRIGFPHQLTVLLALVSAIYTTNALAEAPAAQGNVTSSASVGELETLVGPIALYPDDLVAIILPASTNPLQIVQAERFLEKRKADPKLAVDDGWDDAIKSLVNYPEVIQKMSGDLDWTTALGEAVVSDQGAVLEAVQVFRRKTQSAGNLKSDTKQTVVVEKEVIKIVQADPQVIYVPQYNPTTVVVAGSPAPYTYYPAPYPVYYYPYPPGAALATGLIWGAAIGAAWNGGHYHADYHGGSANINVDRSNNVNINNPGGSGQRPGGGSSQWKPNKQPGQVGRTASNTSARPGQVSSPSRSGAGSTASPRASTQPTGGSRGGDSALGGYSSGRQTQMDSSRGASSRESMSRGSQGSRSSFSGGGSSRSFSGGGSGRSRGGGRR